MSAFGTVSDIQLTSSMQAKLHNDLMNELFFGHTEKRELRCQEKCHSFGDYAVKMPALFLSIIVHCVNLDEDASATLHPFGGSTE